MAHATVSPQMQKCIDECLKCYRMCTETIRHCLSKGGKHAEAEHITLLQDCAEICQTSAGFMLRGSHQHAETCRACAEVCRACAESCGKMADDQMMKDCAEACRRCAESCQQMAGAAV